MMRFYAAFKGVDIDEDDEDSPKKRLERAKMRANAKILGEELPENNEGEPSFDQFGIEVETVE